MTTTKVTGALQEDGTKGADTATTLDELLALKAKQGE
jgi:hypothetical protein